MIQFLIDENNDINSCIVQIRPNELIFNVLNELKNNNSSHPLIAIWTKAEGIEYEIYLNYYNKYSDLIFKSPNLLTINHTIQKAYFINSGSSINKTIINIIKSNNIQVINMWCDQQLSSLNNGTCTFFQSSHYNGGKNGYKEHTSLEMINECNF